MTAALTRKTLDS